MKTVVLWIVMPLAWLAGVMVLAAICGAILGRSDKPDDEGR